MNKAIEWLYGYDPEGNIISEYRDGALKSLGIDSSMHGMERYNLKHTYDALNRLTSTNGDNGYKAHNYSYDSLGNLTYETIGNSKTVDYKYNKLNQLVSRIDDGKNNYTYTYDRRGNNVSEVYNKNLSKPSQDEFVASYVYDSTNRMVKGTNAAVEQSHYIFNGFGDLLSNEWIIEKNAYGYTGIEVSVPSAQVNGVVAYDRHNGVISRDKIDPKGKGYTKGGTTGSVVPALNSKKQSVIHKDYVLDYTSPLKNILTETEAGINGFTYRFTYGLDKLNTVITGIPNGTGSVMQYIYNDANGNIALTITNPGKNTPNNGIVKLWYHHDHLGSTSYLTDNVQGKVESFISYDDWGALTAKTVIRMGVRELDLVQEYTGHPADMVLSFYYAKARTYAFIFGC